MSILGLMHFKTTDAKTAHRERCSSPPVLNFCWLHSSPHAHPYANVADSPIELICTLARALNQCALCAYVRVGVSCVTDLTLLRHLVTSSTYHEHGRLFD